MGLDIYITRIKKPVLSGNGPFLSADLEDQGLFVMPAKEFAEDSAFQEILPYTTLMNVIRTKVDFDAIAKNFGLKKNSIHVFRWNQGSISIGGKRNDNGMGFSVTLQPNMVQKHFLTDVMESCYVFSREDVYHINGHGEEIETIQNYMYEHFSVDNCKYCLLNVEDIDALNHILHSDVIRLDPPTENSALFYQEWY